MEVAPRGIRIQGYRTPTNQRLSHALKDDYQDFSFDVGLL